MVEDCIFCKIARGDIPAEVVFEDNEIMAFKDLHAKAPVHILFIPKKHIPTINDLQGQDLGLAGRILGVISKVATSLGIGLDGYRVVVNCGRNGGQEIYHLHFHLLGGRALSWPPG